MRRMYKQLKEINHEDIKVLYGLDISGCEDMVGRLGERINLIVNGKKISRVVRINKTDGLYVVVKNIPIFEYEIE